MLEIFFERRYIVSPKQTHSLVLDTIRLFPYENWVVGMYHSYPGERIGLVHRSSLIEDLAKRKEAYRRDKIESLKDITLHLQQGDDGHGKPTDLFPISAETFYCLDRESPLTLQPSKENPETVHIDRAPGDFFTVGALRNRGTQNLLTALHHKGYDIDHMGLCEPDHIFHPRFSEYSRLSLFRHSFGEEASFSVTVYRRKAAKQFRKDLQKFLKKLDKKYHFKLEK